MGWEIDLIEEAVWDIYKIDALFTVYEFDWVWNESLGDLIKQC